MGHVTRPLPFQGWFVIRGLGLSPVNVHTKFEVSISSDEDMKRDTKCRKWGGMWYSEVTQGHWKWQDSIKHMSSY